MALVNGEVITLSDLMWSLALDPKAPSPAGAVSSDALRQKLEIMIDERVIGQEAARLPGPEVSREEVNKYRTDLIAQFSSEATFRTRVESVGLTAERIDELIKKRIVINRFIDFRFRSFVFVSEQEIQRYFDDRLAPEIRRAGRVPPSLDPVKEKIRELLRQEKINEELDRWLTSARQRADVLVLNGAR